VAFGPCGFKSHLRHSFDLAALRAERTTKPRRIKELERLADELALLVARINRTNLRTTLADGETLTDALARRDALTLKYRSFSAVANAAGENAPRHLRSEIRLLPAVDVAALRKQTDEFARERRELDAVIQETNWQTDLEH
jgi:hypothetical protein